MIRWCSYCQMLLGEVAPLTDYALTHGICDACDARLEAGEHLKSTYEQHIELHRRLFRAARNGDISSCADIVEQGLSRGYSPSARLVGLMQPALVEIGSRWEVAEVSVSDEHRFTAWCEAAVALLPEAAKQAPGLDLLIVQAPGNLHDLGGRIAERVLGEAGLRCLALRPSMPLAELLARISALRPRWVGFSCALPRSLDAVRSAADALRGAGYEGGLMASGQAFRRPGAPDRCDELIVCRTVADACAWLRRPEAAAAAS